jgi:hypothetical protein
VTYCFGLAITQTYPTFQLKDLDQSSDNVTHEKFSASHVVFKSEVNPLLEEDRFEKLLNTFFDGH